MTKTNAGDSAAPGGSGDPAGNRHVVRRIGTVTSDRMAKSIVVRVDRTVMHPVYKKIVRRHTKLVAHDENNEARTGDTVEVVFTRPISSTKRWRLLRVVTAVPRSAATTAGPAAVSEKALRSRAARAKAARASSGGGS